MNIEKEASNEAARIKNEIESNSFTVYQIEKKQYNYEFLVTSGNDKLKVQVFFGKKGVKTILQGNKESDLYNEINSIVFGESLFSTVKEDIIEPDNYIGTDESGKGDFFGPLTVCAFYSDNEIKSRLLDLGVKDSKLLSDTQINSAANKIKNLKDVFYEVVHISPSKYNELYGKFRNLNLLLNWAHSKAIEVLLSKVETDTVITDKFSKKELNIAGNGKHNVNFIQTEKGERFLGVAAASILARNSMNLWFEKQKSTGLILPKGASGEVEQAAKAIRIKYGESKLQQLAKLHFKTFQKIK